MNQIARLKELLARATPAPWHVEADSVYRPGDDGYASMCVADATGRGVVQPASSPGTPSDGLVTFGKDDARLIAELRNAAPAIVQRLEEAELMLRVVVHDGRIMQDSRVLLAEWLSRSLP